MPTDVKAVSDAKWYSCHKVTWSPTDSYLQFFDIPLSLIFISIHFHSLQKSTHHSRGMEPLAISLSKCHMVQFSVSMLSALTRSCLAATHGVICWNSFCCCSTQLCSHLATPDFFTSQAWETVGYSFTGDWVLQDRTAICLKLNSYNLGLTSAQWLITVHSSAFVQLLFSLQPFQSPVSPLHKLRSSLLEHFIIILKSNLIFLFYELFQSHWPIKVCL